MHVLPPELQCLVFAQLPLKYRFVCKFWRDNIDSPNLKALRNLQNKKFKQVVTPFTPREQTWNWTHLQFFPWCDGMGVEVIVFLADSIWHRFFDFSYTETAKSCLSDPRYDNVKKYFDPWRPEQAYNHTENVKTCIYRDTLYKSSPTGIQLFKYEKKEIEEKWSCNRYFYTEGEKLPQEFACPGLLDFIVLMGLLLVSVNGVIKVHELATFKHLYDIDDHHYTYFGASRRGVRIHAHSSDGWVLLDFGVTPLPKTHSFDGQCYKQG